MVRKPGSMYRNVRQRSFTRRKYMGGVPGSQVIHYDMGDKSNTTFPIKVSLVVEEKCQIRHVALESARVTANRHLSADAGKMGFYMKLRVYPHEVLRENKQATGAGADAHAAPAKRRAMIASRTSSMRTTLLPPATDPFLSLIHI